jgi:hypothetical protein
MGGRLSCSTVLSQSQDVRARGDWRLGWYCCVRGKVHEVLVSPATAKSACIDDDLRKEPTWGNHRLRIGG